MMKWVPGFWPWYGDSHQLIKPGWLSGWYTSAPEPTADASSTPASGPTRSAGWFGWPLDGRIRELRDIAAKEKAEADAFEEESKDKCPICLDTLEEGIKKLDCGHKFHTKCIHKWVNKEASDFGTCDCPYTLRNQKKCPICRAPI